MLIRRHDAPIDPENEWRQLLLDHPFGTLIAPGADRELPIVVPSHFHFDRADTVLLHLARANPVWRALTENPRCMLSVVAAVTYVPTSWEAPSAADPEWGIPTSHYATAQLDCTATIVDDPTEISAYLAHQLATMQPDEPFGDPLDPDSPNRDQLSRIRGLHLAIHGVRAKFKFDGAEPDEVRRQVIAGYQRRRGPGDAEASAHLVRRHPVEHAKDEATESTSSSRDDG